MKRQVIASLVFGAFLIVGTAQQRSGTPEALLGRAVHQEEAEGDLEAAIATYKEFLTQHADNRPLAAKAQFRLGASYEKLGRVEARKAYERFWRPTTPIRRVLADYADQTDLVTQARARLAALDAAAANQGSGVTIRKLDFGVEHHHGEAHPWNVSADGRYLGATNYSTLNAAVVDVAAGKYRNVTDYNWSAFADQAAISRDGKRIAFWHYKDGAKEGNLRVIGADGKGERVLLKGDDYNRGWGIPTDWSPDGKYVAVELEGKAAGEAEGSVIDFALVPADGGEVRIVKTLPLAARHRPKLVFSPSGRYLAYDFPARVGAQQTDLYILPITGGQETAIAAHPARESFVGWTPDGDILFLSERTGMIGLYRVAVENGRQSGEPQLLKDSVGDIEPLGITDAGSLYYSETRHLWNTYVVSVNISTGKLLSKPVKVTERFQDSVSMPSWSLDGRYFSYVRHQSGGAAATVIIREVSSGEERELLPAVALQEQGSKVRWHPDGKSLLAIGAKDDQSGLFRISIDTGEASLVYQTSHIKTWNSGDWDPDANRYFSIGAVSPRPIVRRNLETGEERTIYNGESSVRNLRVSPNGRLVAFLQWAVDRDAGDQTTLRVVPTAAGSSKELLSRQQEGARFSWSSLSTAWSKDSRNILFVRGQPEVRESELWVVPADQ